MLRQVKDMVFRILRNPRYFGYYLKNLHLVRDHFPRLHAALAKRKELDLGRAVENPLKLHVVLRTTDRVLNLNANRDLEQIGLVTKRDVIALGGCSLFGAAQRFAEKYGHERLKITLVSDNLSDAGLALYRKGAERVGIAFDVVPSKGHGNGPSFQSQIDRALMDDDATIEFICEDDYLMCEETLLYPFEVMQKYANVAGFSPHFHPGRVHSQDIGKIAVAQQRLCCRVPNTCCTFFIRRSVVKKYESKLRLYDGWEDGSVNEIWRKNICLSPLGWTLAEHLHRSDLSPFQKLIEE